uniref:Uncharacterized protein n=1 Tax=Rhizophora mucronata TaxID=61149 RepID=A0A2P2NWU6_RHIMU
MSQCYLFDFESGFFLAFLLLLVYEYRILCLILVKA